MLMKVGKFVLYFTQLLINDSLASLLK